MDVTGTLQGPYYQILIISDEILATYVKNGNMRINKIQDRYFFRIRKSMLPFVGGEALGHRGWGYLRYKDVTSEGLAKLCIHDYASKGRWREVERTPRRLLVSRML